METRSLRHRKRQKKTKPSSDKESTNVLIVPPDILKKLGISIDNSSSVHQSVTIANIKENTDTAHNEVIATVPTSNMNVKSNESSCLETASLMMKSVFLSPSFIPSSAILDSDEEKISNYSSSNGTESRTERFPLENYNFNGIYFKNNRDLLETASKERQVPMELCNNNIKEIQMLSDNGANKLLNVDIQNEKYTATRVENVELCLPNGNEHGKTLSSMNIQDQVIDLVPTNLISLRESVNELEESPFQNGTKRSMENNNIKNFNELSNKSIPSNTLQIYSDNSKEIELDDHSSSMQTEIQQNQSEHEHNSTLLKSNEYAIENVINIPTEEKVIQTVQDEARNSSSSMPESSFHMKQVEYNIKSLDRFQMELEEVEGGILGLENKLNDMQKSKSDVSINGIGHPKEYVVLDIGVNSLNANTIPLLLNENNIISLQETVNLLEDAKDVNNVTEHESNAIVTHDQSDEAVSHIITTIRNINGYTLQELEEQNRVQIRSNVIEQRNNTYYNDFSQTQSSYNGQHDNLQQESFELNFTRSDLDMVTLTNNNKQKINIICAETIPSCDLKKVHFPVIKSLTPVPLNSIIIPKTNNDFQRNTTINNEVMTSEVTIENDPSSTLSQTECVPLLNKKLLTQNDCECDVAKFEYSDEVNTIKNSYIIHNKHALELTEFKYEEKLDNRSRVTEDDQSLRKSRDKMLLVTNNDKICTENVEIGQDCIKDIRCLRNTSEMKTKNNESLHITDITTQDKEDYNNEINKIVKSNDVNSDINTHQDKVKELAEYIKRHAHLYKVNKTEIKKECNEIAANKNNTINSKSNITKSKLCIQGVEKPGGYKHKIGVSDKAIGVKTYSRQKKEKKPSTFKNKTSTEVTALCDINNDTETDLITANISMSSKAQDFCLCYDFGRLDASNYDNLYEHVHFGLRHDNNDLNAILSIYNDEETSLYDRTKLNNVPILESIEDNTKTSNICWNYFLSNENDTANQRLKNDCRYKSADLIMAEVPPQEKDALTAINVQSHFDDDTYTNKTEHVEYDIIESSTKTLINDGNNDYKELVVVEAADVQDLIENIETAVCDTTPTMSSEDNILHEDGTLQQYFPKHCKGSDLLPKIIKMVREEEGNHDVNKEIVEQGTSTSKSMKDFTEKEPPIKEQESNEQGNRKRSLQVDNTSEEPSSKKNVKCGVCNKLLPEVEWNIHIAKKHNYIAWKAGESFDFDDPNLIKKLQQMCDTSGSLKCSNCYFKTNNVNKFIVHKKTCIKQDLQSRRASSSKNLIICGVCHSEVAYLSWNEHIGKEHNYLAWIEGQKVLNIEDEVAVLRHLQNIIECHGSLLCYKCGFSRKRAKGYLAHMEMCDGKEIPNDDSSEVDSLAIQTDIKPSTSDKKTITCGVCKKEILILQWTEHIGKEHNYLAWEEGSSPLDWNNEEVVWNHLQEFIRNSGGLRCYKCGLNRKRVKLYLSHIETCNGDQTSLDESAIESSLDQSSDEISVQCAVCQAKVTASNWNEHIGREHNYLAWRVGATPLDVNDENAVKEHLQDIIRTSTVLICYKCGVNRKRVRLYLSHIKTCDGTQSQFNQSTTSDLNCTANSEQIEIAIDQTLKIVKCGVCDQDVSAQMWIEHIGREHKYLAWRLGEEPLDLENEEGTKAHLLTIARENNGLICYMCQTIKKYPKTFQQHVKICKGVTSKLDQSTSSDLNCTANSEQIEVEIDQTLTVVKCGVCDQDVLAPMWIEHIGREHKYLAWQQGEKPLDLENEDAIKAHLLTISKENGLICYMCRITMKYPKPFLHHVKKCKGVSFKLDQSTTSDLNCTANSEQIEIAIDQTLKIVKCGVCDQDVSAQMWIEHIGREHKYLAWRLGEEPLDLENEEAVKAHLTNITRENNGLICYTCKTTKKYPKPFMQHVKNCKGLLSPGDTSELQSDTESLFDISDIKSDTVICGVCNKVLVKSDWIKHMEEAHDYMAWLQGRPALDLNDYAMLQRHLIEVSRKTKGLKCKNCGVIRKYAKPYLEHIGVCGSKGNWDKDSVVIRGKDSVECGVCSAIVEPNDWRAHAMKVHYNVAWIAGTTPIEINNPYGVEPYIKQYQAKHGNKLVCRTCGINRVSAVGFYAHIITCGKTDEEMEIYKSLCSICNNKYLRIYKSQHMTMHKEKELAVERKLLAAKEKELVQEEIEPVEIVGGRRKAAEKAITVIEKYASKTSDGSHCQKCGFTSDIALEMSNHVCVAKQEDNSESDESVKTDNSSGEDDDTDIDSNISDEEREARDGQLMKSKKHGDSSRHTIKRLPYRIRNINNYLRRSADELASLHMTDEDLFTQYHNFNYEVVSESEIHKYMPPLAESCKIRFKGDEDWVTCKRFEATKQKEIITMFTGSCIYAMCWVPRYVNEHKMASDKEYLSVLTSLSTDKPRHSWDDKPAPKPALIQIWDCANFTSCVPEFAMGLAFDCGTIWAFDWCPSGTRDIINLQEECTETRRLGLIAIACASGSAFVFVVPDPSTIKEKGQLFYKLKPVAELRLAMDTNRKVFQATAIKWSPQKGHAHIVVGYADGTTAFYDLKNVSPLLKCTENGVDIIYPYHDERAQGVCIEDVDVFPMARGHNAGVTVTGSVGGAGTRLLHSHFAATKVMFPPHWPAALLAGDDNLVSQAVNELEWYGGGRRVGGMRTVCGCIWCGRLVAASPPLIRLMRTHPSFDDLHKQVIATLQMVTFGSKRKRKNDELTMIMEPLTYNDAITKYGLELHRVTSRDRNSQQKLTALPREAYPERFPLADVTAMAFCPSLKNHSKLTIATHAGVIFIMSI